MYASSFSSFPPWLHICVVDFQCPPLSCFSLFVLLMMEMVQACTQNINAVWLFSIDPLFFHILNSFQQMRHIQEGLWCTEKSQAVVSQSFALNCWSRLWTMLFCRCSVVLFLISETLLESLMTFVDLWSDLSGYSLSYLIFFWWTAVKLCSSDAGFTLSIMVCCCNILNGFHCWIRRL